MEKRYRLQNKARGFICEAPHSPEGLEKLRAIRKMLPNLFRNGRILSMIQANPSEVTKGLVYKIGERHGWKPEYCLEEIVKAENEDARRPCNTTTPHLFRHSF